MNRFIPLCLFLISGLNCQAVLAAGSGTGPKCIEDICFDSDRLSYLVAPEGVRERLLDHEPEGELNGRVLHSRADFNGDGITDLGILELKGESLKKLHSSYEVYLGIAENEEGITYPSRASTRIDSDGIPFDLLVEDFNGDGTQDMTIMVIHPGVMKMMGMVFSSVFTDSIKLDLEFYPMRENTFSPEPELVRKVRTVSLGKSGEPAAIFPEISFSDSDGDGRVDLLVQTGAEEHDLFLAGTGEQLFAKKPRKLIARAESD